MVQIENFSPDVQGFILDFYCRSYQSVLEAKVVGQRVAFLMHAVDEDQPWSLIHGLVGDSFQAQHQRYDNSDAAMDAFHGLVDAWTQPAWVTEARRQVHKATKAAERAYDKARDRYYRNRWTMPESGPTDVVINRDFSYTHGNC